MERANADDLVILYVNGSRVGAAGESRPRDAAEDGVSFSFQNLLLCFSFFLWKEGLIHVICESFLLSVPCRTLGARRGRFVATKCRIELNTPFGLVT